MPSPQPCFSHSLETTVLGDHKSDKVCLLLENSHSTAILTPEIARMFHAMRDRTGKSAWVCSLHHHFSQWNQVFTLSIQTWEHPAEITLKFDKCLLLIGCHAEDRLHESRFNLVGWQGSRDLVGSAYYHFDRYHTGVWEVFTLILQGLRPKSCFKNM